MIFVGIVILIVLLAVYAFLFCLPGYILVVEGLDGAGCGLTVCGIIGFPGMFIGGIVLLVRETKAERTRKEAEERERREKAEREERERREKAEREKRVAAYVQRDSLKRIVREISARGIPYKIEINSTGVTAYVQGGTITHTFLTNGEEDIVEVWGDYKQYTGKAYLMGLAINRMFGNVFTVHDCVNVKTINEMYSYVSWDRVELCRKLKEI